MGFTGSAVLFFRRLLLSVAALLLLLSSLVVSSGEIEHTLQCEAVDQAGHDISLMGGDHAFVIKAAERGCESVYVYRTFFNEKSGGFVFVSPTASDLGLNAQNVVYFVPSGSHEALYVGAIPAGAMEVAEGRYQNIVQSGGSIFKEDYQLTNRQVILLFPVLEWVVAGTQCVFADVNESTCEHLSGTFQKPLCVMNINGRKLKADPKDCAGMMPG